MLTNLDDLFDRLTDLCLGADDKILGQSLYELVDAIKTLLRPRVKCAYINCRNIAVKGHKYKTPVDGFTVSVVIPACKLHIPYIPEGLTPTNLIRFTIGDFDYAVDSNSITEARMETKQR